MTQAPATPELVERLKDAAERFLKWTYDQPYSGSPVISIPRHPNNIDAILCEAADALEAQQARIAELEAQLLQTNLAWDDATAAKERWKQRADRYEKALREIADLAEECVVFDAENVAAVEAAPDKAAASPGFSVLRYWNDRLKLSKSWKRRVDEIRDQALSSSQGRREGGGGGLPELPGVNTVPLPASPDGLDPKNWEVEVRIDGERVLTIGHSHLSGIEDIDRYGDTVRTCAEHLKSFIGSGEPEPCFGCGGSGQERWMGWNGEEVGPCSICQPELPSPDNTNPEAEHG